MTDPEPPAERAADRWEGAGAEELAAAWGASAVRLYSTVGSTSDVARRIAEEGAPAGTLVLAEEQTAGRGRAGRRWSSPPGLGLWASIVARPGAVDGLAVAPLVLALAAAEALDRWAGPPGVGIKWPNDLQVARRKLGGILCEAVWSAGALSHLVVGIGINVLHQREDFPPELRPHATSLALASGQDVARREVADALFRSLLPALTGELVLGPDRVERFARRDVLSGRAVTVADPATGAEVARGRAAGVAADGGLRLTTEQGDARVVRSGTVRALDDPG